MKTRCLEVVAAGRAILVPIETIAGVAEHELLPPPPLSRPEIGGLARRGTELFSVISLGDGAPAADAAARTQKCVLFRKGRERFRFGLMVDVVARMVEAESHGPPDESWMAPARDTTGRSIPMFDVARAAGALELPEGTERR